METTKIALDVAKEQRDLERRRQNVMDATKITLQFDVETLAKEHRNTNSDIKELRDITSLAFSDFYTMLLLCVTWNIAGGIFLIWIRSWSALLGTLVGSALSFVLWGFLSLVMSHAVWMYTFNSLWFITGITFAFYIVLGLFVLLFGCCTPPENQEEQNGE